MLDLPLEMFEKPYILYDKRVCRRYVEIRGGGSKKINFYKAPFMDRQIISETHLEIRINKIAEHFNSTVGYI